MDRYLLGGLSPKTFLDRYWQKKPLLVRGAFRKFKDPLTPDELAGLAMEAGVEARLIRERGGKRPWELTHGPFARRQLEQLPDSHWTLLVSRVNEMVADAARMLDKFSFIPDWRLDDLMVSFAARAGTVGPHIDSYDVFLIQGLGRRSWQIASRPDPELRRGVDLKMLKRFKPERGWILEPGDMLYLPPGVAHHGVALEPCMTYSVGFRAPSVQALALDLLALDGAGVARLFGERLYEDPDLLPVRHPGELGADALRRVAAIAKQALDDPALLGRWLGAVVTRPMPGVEVRTRRVRLKTPFKTLKARPIRRVDRVRAAWFRPSKDQVAVFVEGEERLFAAAAAPLVRALFSARLHPPGSLLKTLPRSGPERDQAVEALRALVGLGAFEVE